MSTQETSTLIAIVDDDGSVRSALEGMMQEAGFATFVCASAEEFLDSARKGQTSCLITDIRMPGISGLELQSRLNATRQGIPIIFISAHGDEDLRLQALRAGAVEFLAKPFDDAQLLDGVRAALNHVRPMRSGASPEAFG
jgi:FixJ family two-component response regulator